MRRNVTVTDDMTDVDGLDLKVRKKVLVRLCNRRKRELEAILQGSVEVIIFD